MLGTIDPTLLASGPYMLRLTATDADPDGQGGSIVRTSTVEQLFEVAGKFKLGNFNLSFTDMTVPVAGIPITVIRTYDTLRSNEDGDFGYGWGLGFGEIEVAVDQPPGALDGFGIYDPFVFYEGQPGPADDVGTHVTITREDGSTEGFTFKTWWESDFIGRRTYHPYFEADPGVTSYLEVADRRLESDGAGGYIDWDAGAVSYNPANPACGGSYTLVTPDGLRRKIKAESGDLEKITERHGNEIAFTATGIESNRGRKLTVERDGWNRIKRISDPAGNAVTYEYDDAGNLKRVFDRIETAKPVGERKFTEYTYVGGADYAHHLGSIKDPLGRTTATAAYKTTGADAGRLDRITDAFGKSVSFSYDTAARTQTASFTRDDTTVETATTGFDERGNLTRQVDAAGQTTLREYLDAGGVKTFLTKETRVVGAVGGDDDLVTTYGSVAADYDLFGNPLKVTDPLGNVSRYTYNRAGQVTTVTDPLGDTTTYGYGLFEYASRDGRAQQSDLRYVADPAKAATVFNYDAYGNVSQARSGIPFNNFSWYDLYYDGYYEQYYNPNAPSTDPARQPLSRPEYSGTKFVYQPVGDLVKTVDRSGASATTSDDNLPWTKFVSDGLGNRELSYQWWSDPSDPANQSKWKTIVDRSVYDAEGRATGTKQYVVSGHVDYTAGANLDGQTPLWTTSTAYDDFGRAYQTTDRFNGVTESIYDARGTVIKTTQPDGKISHTVYDEKGRTVWTDDPHLPGQAANGTKTIYDSVDRVTHTERYANVVIALDPDPTWTGAYRSSLGSSGALLSTTSNVYDDAGRVYQSTDTSNHTTTYFYDKAGAQTAVEDAVGGQTRRTEYSYDAAGRQSLVHDALGRDTKYEYDDAGRVTKTILADGSFTATTYDIRGRVIAEQEQGTTSAPGRTKNFEYDASGRLTAVVLPEVLNPETATRTRPRYEYQYDQRGNRTLIRDAKNRETRFTYDEQGRQLTRTLPGGEAEENRYNALGQVALHIDFEGKVTEYIYDNTATGQGRVTGQRFFDNLATYDNGQGTPAETVSFTYDSLGRVYQTIEPRGTTTFSYDLEGRTTRIDSPEGAVNYEYDAPTGRLVRTYTGTTDTARTSVGNDGKAQADTRYEYDDLGRLSKVKVYERNDQPLASPEETSYNYDLVGNLKEVRLPKQPGGALPTGIITDYVYDQLDRLDKLTQYGPDATPDNLLDNPKLAEFDYTLRADGKRSGVSETHWIDGVARAIQTNWTYDEVGRLTDEVFNHYDDNLDFSAHYVYDLVGNRRSKTVDNASNGPGVDETITYAYDSNDRLLTESKDLASGTDTTTTYTYGTAGHATMLTGKSVRETASNNLVQTTAYEYNLQGRMKQAVVETHTGGNVVRRETSQFVYDNSGIRVKATTTVEVDNDGNPATPLVQQSRTETTFLSDAQNPTGYSQVLQETTRDLVTNNLIETKVYTLGQDVLAQTTFTPGGATEGVTVYLLYDAHGSTRAVAAVDAAILQRYAYDAYGNALGFDPGQSLTRLLYNGEQFDARLTMDYVRARYYDAAIGRFNRVDPVAGSFRDPLSLHTYLFTPSDPVNFNDPSGQSFILSVTIATAIRGTIAGLTMGAINAAYAYAKGATLGEALWSGVKTAALTGFAFISPLFAWSMLAATPALLGLGIYSGAVSGEDVPEIASYVVAGIALQILFKSPAYNVFEVKTALKIKVPQAVQNLKNGTSVNPARNAKWDAAVHNGNKAAQGSLIHAEVADLMRAQNMGNLKIEVSYDASGNATTYGARGSVRLDYEVIARGQTARVIDLKPGDVINGSWIRKVASRLGIDQETIEAFSYGRYL